MSLATLLLALAPSGSAAPEPPADPPLPLAPATPPGVPPAVPPAPAAGEVTCAFSGHIGCPHSVEVCREKAVAAMERKGFRFGEVRDDGSVVGYSATCRGLVLLLPQGQGTSVLVWVGGRSLDECQRVASSIRDYILSAPPPAKAESRFGKPDPDLDDELPVIRYRVEVKPAVPTIRYFDAVAGLSMEKLGYTPQPLGKGEVVLGAGRGRAATAFVTPGPVPLTLHYGVVMCGEDDAVTDKVIGALFDKIAKTLTD